jgi:hypothetical protein
MKLSNIPINVLEALDTLGKNTKTLKGVYLLNIVRLAKKIKESFNDYSKLKEQIIIDYAEKDVDGAPKVSNENEYKIPADIVKEVTRKLLDIQEGIDIDFSGVSISEDELEEMELDYKTIEALYIVGIIKES